jgi:hypothetical protein
MLQGAEHLCRRRPSRRVSTAKNVSVPVFLGAAWRLERPVVSGLEIEFEGREYSGVDRLTLFGLLAVTAMLVIFLPEW